MIRRLLGLASQGIAWLLSALFVITIFGFIAFLFMREVRRADAERFCCEAAVHDDLGVIRLYRCQDGLNYQAVETLP